MWTLLHPDQGGTINFKELCFGLSLLSNDQKKSEKSRLTFSIYDAKGRGFIDEDDIAVVVLHGYGMTAAANVSNTVRQILARFGEGGKLNFEQFCVAIDHAPGLVKAAKHLLQSKPLTSSTPKPKKKEKAHKKDGNTELSNIAPTEFVLEVNFPVPSPVPAASSE